MQEEPHRRPTPPFHAVTAVHDGPAADAGEWERLVERERLARAEAEQRAREEKALREAVLAIGASLTTEEVIHQIASGAMETTSAVGALVTWVHAREDEVEVVSVAGKVPPPCPRFRHEGSYTEKVAARGEPILIRRLADFDGPLWSDEVLRDHADWSVLVVPLASPQQPIGALFLLREPGVAPSTPDEVARSSAFGQLAALALRKVDLLEEAQKRSAALERLSKSRTRLMRGFSHDLKNPLGAADGYAQLLEEGILGEMAPKQKESVQRIRRSIHTCLRLIQDLLELARAEAGQLEVERIPTDVAAVAREVAEDFRAQATGRGLALQDDIRDPLRTDTDPMRVRQVLANLVSNAVKYTAEGTVSVTGESGAGSAPIAGDWLCVRVTDTGPGIPADKQEQIFQEFTRLDSSEKDGAGVGLAISRKIAQLLGGEITVESEVGRGSTFTFWLPRTGE
ncbi:MAG TPA: HAMP domain-containing sensor histidine kinase [Longimicrobiaceae bacterium]|nr:HAMP domain-containing sensor histidine kinase [Longimicrobiaceae bacterium]